MTSAVELSAAQKTHYAEALAKRLGREVRLSCQTDPSLLGGAVVRADDLVIDGSVRAGLTQLAAATVQLGAAARLRVFKRNVSCRSKLPKSAT